ncbi:helix-turn-helix domain-containing protein [Arundinibacter roseus]|uniref:Helix-turn-helix domain-containing protein n=1 Tax=Arundinibacter roseus TaxID=2070510 RepID=A0A4R4K1G2_9BACT|nr:helix-turn-helix domain-containing protein [Arundinibacter roseus]TDB59819.1 helix-turn-helix domain-containing protein [Arundinibacter roseus]
MTLSERIRNLRLQKGFSQENMADMLAISTSAYGDIERGRTEPPLSRLEAIAGFLETTLPDLLGLEAGPLTETEWLRRENEELRTENARLHQEIGQWKSKFCEWVSLEIARQMQQQRERIGF